MDAVGHRTGLQAGTPNATTPARRRIRRLPAAFWFSLVWTLLVFTAAVTAPWWPVPPPDQMNWEAFEASPGTRTADVVRQTGPGEYTYWLGADTMGRDNLSRLIHGARVSLAVGLASPLIGIVVGGLLGCMAGFYRGRLETLIVTAMDVVLAFPGLVLLLIISFYLGANLKNLILALGFLTIPAFCRVARAQTLSLAKQEFVAASRLSGSGDIAILLREIAPNVLIPVAVYGLIVVAFLIMAEGALSFLGLGLPAPTPSWGGMIAEGKEVLDTSPHISAVPAAAMFLTVLAFNLMADSIRATIDQRGGQR